MGAIIAALTLVLLIALELLWPLRRSVESKPRRMSRNLVFAGLSGLTVIAIERPLVLPLAGWVTRSGFGLVPQLGLPAWARIALACVLLDYTLYMWHVLTHKTPFLWRFHRVHHADLDLDTSTALRFHFGEIALSVPFRAAQVALIGVSVDALVLWQTLLLVLIFFHHSNLALPIRLERVLSRLIITPRLHGIHHSVVLDERDANWSSGLTLWDRLHGTLRLEVPQAQITIGVPELQEVRQVRLGAMLALPARLSGAAAPPVARRPPPPSTGALAA